MLTSKYSYKFMRQRKQNSYVNPVLATLPLKKILCLHSGISTEKSLHFILNICLL